MDTVNQLYSSTMAALYSGCETVADNLEVNLVAMAAFRGRYDAAFVTATRAAVTAAKNLPDDQARGTDAQALLSEMKLKKDEIMSNWIDTGRYIEGTSAFPKTDWQMRREEAGSKHFNKVGNNNWEALVSGCTSAKAFLVAKQVALEDGGANMPAGFVAQFKTASDEFDVLYGKFKVAEQTTVGRNAKVNANNAIFTTAMEICKDGQAKFKNDEGLLKQFTWTTVQELINPPGSASWTITVMLAESDAPAEGAKFKYQREGDSVTHEVVIDATGILKVNPIDPGRYKWICELAGRVSQGDLKDVNTGVDARLEVKLKLI